MVEMNLFPWRDTYGQYQCRQLITYVMTSFVVTLMAMMLWHSYLQREADRLHQMESQLKEQIASYHVLDSDTAQNQAQLSSLVTSVTLDQNNLPVRDFFGLFSRQVNRAVCFTRVTRKRNEIVFQGRAMSVDDLTDFLKQWPVVALFMGIQLQEMKALQSRVWFQLKANF